MKAPETTSFKYWDFVALSDFRPPAPSVEGTLKNRFFGFFGRARTRKGAKESSDGSMDRLTGKGEFPLPEVPESYWLEGADAFDSMLNVVAVQDRGVFRKRCLAMIGPPFGGQVKVLRNWAGKNRCEIVEPPERESIPSGGEEIFGRLSNANPGEVRVIPELEKFFLRSVKGLRIVRRFFEALSEGKIGRVVIGCDSWAWAFLSSVLGGEPVSAVIGQALSPERMTGWLSDLVVDKGRENAVFRRMGDDAYVLPPRHEEKDESPGEFAAVGDIKLLSEYCRGNPGLARFFWKRMLSSASGDDPDRPEIPNQETTVRVVPWEKLSKPSIPGDFRREHGMLLHTLLLHGGLRAETLISVLPFTRFETARYISFLEESEFLTVEDGLFSVSPLVLPVLREYLKDEGYLTGL